MFGNKEYDRRWSTESEWTSANARDHELLKRLGKQPVMKRRFGFLTILGFTSTITCLWESTLLLMDQSLKNGGPEGFVYGFILVWAGCLALFACMSELASMAPTAGGQYHWVAMMSPPWCQRFASYVEGWLAVTGWQGSSVSAALLSARTVLGLAKLCHPDFQWTTWQETLVAVGLIGFAMLINVTGGMVLPRFEGMVLVLHLVGFFAVLVPLLTLGHQVDADGVFDVFVNQGDFPSNGLTYWIGLAGIMYAFVGGDGAIHMSEEIHNAEVVVPRGIMFNYVINGALAFGIALVALFSRGALDSIVDPPSGFAIIEVISYSVRSLPGAAIMVSVITVLQISAGVSNYASATRILWGFARDHGIPGWQLVSKVDEKTTVPIFACLITALIGGGLTCINIGSPTAFNDVVSVAIAGLYGSYLVACSLLLWRRSTGAISKHDPFETDMINTVGFRLVWGPFRLRGILGIFINLFACTYLLAAFFFVFWPLSLPVTVDNMNYASAMFGGVIILSAIYYLAWGHRNYFGPVVETGAGVSRHDQHPSLYHSTRISLPPLAPTRESYLTAEEGTQPPTAEYERSGVEKMERAPSRSTIDAQAMGPLEAIGAPRGTSIRHQASDLSRAPTVTDSIRDGVAGRHSYESLLGSGEEIQRPDGAIHPLHPRANTSAASGRRTATPTSGHRALDRYGSGYHSGYGNGLGHARTMSLTSNRTGSLTSKHGSVTNASLRKRSLDPMSQRPSAVVRPWVDGRWESERWEGTEWRDGDDTRFGSNWSERFGELDGAESQERAREESTAGGEREVDGRNSYKRDAKLRGKAREKGRDRADMSPGPAEMALDEGAVAFVKKGFEELGE